MSKVMTASQAISTFVHDGDCLIVGGFVTNRRPYELVREIIRQGKKNLYIEGGISGGDIDMMIGAGCVRAISVSYVADSLYMQVGRRFRDAVETGEILYEDFSIDAQTIMYHGAALGLPFVAVKNMLGSDLEKKWGISEDERKKHSKLPNRKFIVAENPFSPGEQLCYLPTPKIDVTLLHVQKASPDGICRIEGPTFQDVDIAIAAKHTIVTCEELLSDEELRREPGLNTLSGLCVDAVVHVPMGAHPSQCYGYYDYDTACFVEYERAAHNMEDFRKYVEKRVTGCKTREDYLAGFSPARLLSLKVQRELGYAPGKNKK